MSSELKLQLAMIAGNEPETSFIELRPFEPDGTPSRVRLWIPVRQLTRAQRMVRYLADHGLTVWVGCAPRIRRGGTKHDVERAWALWADCDTADAVGRLRDFKPLPTMVVRSGSLDGDEPKLHAWWQLKTPIPAANVRRANRRIAHALGADDGSVTNPAAVLRPVGSFNRKNGEPRPVECAYLSLDAYTAAEIVGHLDDHPSEIQSAPVIPIRRTGRANLDGLVQTVAQAPAGNRNNLLNWAAYKAGRDVAAGRLNARELMTLADAARAAGLPDHEVTGTIRSGLQSGMGTIA